MDRVCRGVHRGSESSKVKRSDAAIGDVYYLGPDARFLEIVIDTELALSFIYRASITTRTCRYRPDSWKILYSGWDTVYY